MRLIFVFILLMFCVRLTKAQDTETFHSDKSHVFSIYSGLSKYVERDDAMSPYKYRGLSIPIEISYRYTGTKCRQIFYANFDNSRLVSSLPDYEDAGVNHYVQSINIKIGYSYVYKAFTLVKFKSDLYFGAEFSSLLNMRLHSYIHNNELLMMDQFNSLGFKALLGKQFSNKRQSASVSLSIPFISYVLMGNTYNAYVGEKTDPLIDYRRNTLLYLVKNGDFVSFNKLFYFRTEISFTQFFSNHIGIECKYNLRYYKFCQYQEINYSKNLQSQLVIGIVGKL